MFCSHSIELPGMDERQLRPSIELTSVETKIAQQIEVLRDLLSAETTTSDRILSLALSFGNSNPGILRIKRQLRNGKKGLT